MKKIKIMAIMLTCAFGLSMIPAKSYAGKGTLMGNSSGTKFCCSSGTNDCSAAACGAVQPL